MLQCYKNPEKPCFMRFLGCNIRCNISVTMLQTFVTNIPLLQEMLHGQSGLSLGV